MRRRAKVDRNHNEIRDALRKYGCSVQSIAEVGDGCPDLLVGLRGQNFCLEIKDWQGKPSERRLTHKEAMWHANWQGQVDKVESVKDALRAVGLL